MFNGKATCHQGQGTHRKYGPSPGILEWQTGTWHRLQLGASFFSATPGRKLGFRKGVVEQSPDGLNGRVGGLAQGCHLSLQ